MALSRVTYTAAPAQTVFAITFPSLSSDHIELYLDGVQKTNPTHFTINPARTQLTLVTPATGGELVLIKRATPSAAIVDWVDGGVILADDLDTLYLQLLYRVQENEDEQAETLQLLVDGSGNWDGQGLRLTDLADAVDQQDAVTLAQLQAAEIEDGNLPSVTVADNDKFLQVKAGAWVTRTPAQVEADVGVDQLQTDLAALTGRVDDLEDRADLIEADIAALQAGHPLVRAMVPPATALFVSAGASWFENASSRVPLEAFDIERSNGTPHYTKTSDKITITQPGTYLVSTVLTFRGSDDAGVNWRITDDTDGPSQVLHYAGTSLGIGMEANVFPDLSIYAEFTVVVTTTLDLVLRARADAGTTANLTGDAYVKVERFFS